MDLITFYSDSHKEMYEKYFLASYTHYLKDSFNLTSRKIDQLSKTGDYDSDGFMETMMEKTTLILDTLHSGTDPFVFADCDIQFLGDFKEDILTELGDNDIAFQDDVVCRCAGFFIAKRNDVVKRFFDMVHERTPQYFNQQADQTAINVILNSKKTLDLDIKEKFLPKEKYFTIAHSTGAKQWIGQQCSIPPTVLVHHANWTVGLDNKIKLLGFVRENLK